MELIISIIVVIAHLITIWKAAHPKEDISNGVTWQVHGYIDY